MQEQLARLAQREKEAAKAAGLDEVTPALIMEKGKSREAQEKAKRLVSDAFCADTFDLSLKLHLHKLKLGITLITFVILCRHILLNTFVFEYNIYV